MDNETYVEQRLSYLNPSRRLHVMQFRRAHEARRDAGMVFEAAARGRPLELAKRLRLGKLAGGLQARGQLQKDGPIMSALDAARLGGHDRCVELLVEDPGQKSEDEDDQEGDD